MQLKYMFFIMSNRIIWVFAFLILILAPVTTAVAQVNDAGLWASVNLEKKFSKKISLHFSEELRFNENFSELGTVFSELTGEYQFSKMFAVSGGYRFIQKRRLDDSYSTRHRYLINFNVKNKLGPVATNFRIRYQSQYSDIYSSEEGMVPSDYLRTKLSLKYNLQRKYTPFISGEMFVHLNRADGMLLDNYRVSAGMEYEFSKKSSIDLGYMVDREIQVKNPWTSYVVVIGWNYILK